MKGVFISFDASILLIITETTIDYKLIMRNEFLIKIIPWLTF